MEVLRLREEPGCLPGKCLQNSLAAGTDVEFFVDVAEVCADGLDADEQSISNFLVAIPLGEIRHDLVFAA